MSTPHVATPADWAWLEGNSTVDRCDAAWSRGLIELRARVEALEAGATCPHVRTSDEGSSYCALAEQHQGKLDRLIAQDRAASVEARPAPASSLVERVADAIVEQATSAGIVNDRPARAAIREVAAWLRTGRLLHAAELLEQEANR
jgi:hypothetical protein